MIFTYKQNKHLAATDSGRRWVTALLEARLDHIVKGKTFYLPQRALHSHITVRPWHHSCSLWAFPLSVYVLWNAIFIVFSVNSLYFAVKNKTNKLSNIQYIDLVKKFRELRDIRGHPDSSFSLDTEYCQQSKDPTWSSLSSFWIHVHQFLSMYGYSQCLGLVSLFLKNTKHKDILNKITHLNKQ